MNALIIIGFIAAIFYGIFVDGTYFKIYFTLLFLYTVICNHLLINKNDISKRRNILVTSWNGTSALLLISMTYL